MPAKDYRELKVWQAAFETAVELCERIRSFPPEERYALTDQIRRSSRSVAANITEAWRKRRYVGAFVSKLSDADSEAAETEVWLLFAVRHRFISEQENERFSDRYDHICRRLTKMMDQAELWCSTPESRLREEAAEYFVNGAPMDAPRSTLHASRP